MSSYFSWLFADMDEIIDCDFNQPETNSENEGEF